MFLQVVMFTHFILSAEEGESLTTDVEPLQTITRVNNVIFIAFAENKSYNKIISNLFLNGVKKNKKNINVI